MSQQSDIEWTDATWNPVRGCVKVSPGCAHCYAETFAERFRGVPGHPYEQGFDLRLVPDKLEEPLSWKKPRRVFVNSMSDLFQDGVPDEFIDRVFAVMALCPQHTFQVLTKRADRMLEYMAAKIRPYKWDEALLWATAIKGQSRTCFVQPHAVKGRPDTFEDFPLPNVWLGTSVENQHFADERIPLLLQTAAAVRFVSAEPLLGPLDLAGFVPNDQPWKPYVECRHGYDACPMCDGNPSPALDWVIVGGESGPGARTCHVEWIADIVKQCRTAIVPVFVKQMGSVPYVRASRLRHWEWRDIHRPEDKRFTESPDDALGWRVHLSSSKGGDSSEWPSHLRVREFPAVTA